MEGGERAWERERGETGKEIESIGRETKERSQSRTKEGKGEREGRREKEEGIGKEEGNRDVF